MNELRNDPSRTAYAEHTADLAERIRARIDSTAPSAHTARLVETGTAFMELAGLDGQPPAHAAEAAPPAATRAQSEPAEGLDVIVIGGGQAGLSVGYHLKQQGLRFVILDASARVGDAWRKRWDSLRLFSPAWLDSLDGMPMPLPRDSFPTKDQMADYLESYAAHFELPVRSSTKVERLYRKDGRFVVQAGALELSADQVVIAMATFQNKRVPAFARELRADIVQLHSSEYKNPGQLRQGAVLIAGSGNSGAEIAREVSRTHQVVLTGSEVGEVPFQMDGFWGRLLLVRLLMRVVFHRVLTIRTPLGRKARPTMMVKATPLIRVKAKQLAQAGVERIVAKIAGVAGGLPMIEGGRALEVGNVIWCTGYEPSQSFIDLPIFGADGRPEHEAGIVTSEPGLYFVGLPFLFSMSSAMVHGVGRDAQRIAGIIAERVRARVSPLALRSAVRAR